MATRKKTAAKKPVVTDNQIAALAHEAANAHEHEMVKTCGKALAGNAQARKECGRVIIAAKAMAHK